MADHNKTVRVYPFYMKATVILLGLVLVVYVLNILGDVLRPFAIAALFAALLNPLSSRLEKRMPRFIAILLTILLAIVILTALGYFMSRQISMFTESLPVLKQRMTALLAQLQQGVQDHFGIAINKQISMMNGALNNGQQLLSKTLGTILNTVSTLFLLPVYVFLVLFYKPLILEFLFQLYKEEHSLRVAEILSETKSAIQSYMIGLMIETAIVCTLNSIALFVIGVPYPVVIGVIGGILNLLPYLGGIIAILLPIIAAMLVSQGFSVQLLVIAAYALIQFIDNNILVPRIVSSKVQINALISILFVWLGGSLWGLTGMFLSIPFIAVLKIIFDRIDELKPWGKLLGDHVPTEHIGVAWQKRWNRIFKRLQKEKENAQQQDTE